MMGYQEGAFALGYVGDQLDPLAALRGESAKKKTIAEHGNTSDGHRKFASDATN